MVREGLTSRGGGYGCQCSSQAAYGNDLPVLQISAWTPKCTACNTELLQKSRSVSPPLVKQHSAGVHTELPLRRVLQMAALGHTEGAGGKALTIKDSLQIGVACHAHDVEGYLPGEEGYSPSEQAPGAVCSERYAQGLQHIRMSAHLQVQCSILQVIVYLVSDEVLEYGRHSASLEVVDHDVLLEPTAVRWCTLPLHNLMEAGCEGLEHGTQKHQIKHT